MCRTSRNWKEKKKNSLILLKTPCAASELFLVPWASVLSEALLWWSQPSAFLYLWPRGHLCPSAILEKARPVSALQCPSHIDLQAGVQASASSHSALPNPASWPAEPLQRTSLSVRPLRSVELNPIHVLLTFCCMSHELWSQSYGVWDVASVL